jgi:hypothetical protein
VEKVSYYTEGNDLHLVIHPKPNAAAFSTDKIAYKDSSAGFDLIITLGAKNLDGLGSVYTEDASIYSKGQIINIDRHQDNGRFGHVNLVNPSASSLSEMAFELIQSLGLNLNENTATDLLVGIDAATQNFTSLQTTPEAFEAAAAFIRAGGQRSVGDTKATPRPTMPQQKKPQPKTPPPDSVPLPQQTSGPDEKQVEKNKEAGGRGESDWLQPKIYKGGQLL